MIPLCIEYMCTCSRYETGEEQVSGFFVLFRDLKPREWTRLLSVSDLKLCQRLNFSISFLRHSGHYPTALFIELELNTKDAVRYKL